MYYIHIVEMFQSRRNLYQSLLGLQQLVQFVWWFAQLSQKQIMESGLAEVQGDIEEIVATLLAVVSNDVWMIITRLQELDFLTC